MNWSGIGPAVAMTRPLNIAATLVIFATFDGAFQRKDDVVREVRGESRGE